MTSKLPNQYHGWIAVDKPLNVGSTDVVRAVRRAFRTRKVGHAGTLDPLATGVLPIAIGEATKTVTYAIDSHKAYDFTICWGEERSTDDLEGSVTASTDRRPSMNDIHPILNNFIGTIQQTPPPYSAIRINGQRAYDLARKGETVELKPRPVYIKSLICIDSTSESARFKIVCGKGVYVRSIARDLGRQLDCYGHITHLKRTHSASFSLDETISLEKLLDLRHKDDVFTGLHSVARGLADIPALCVTSEEAMNLRQGKQITNEAMFKNQMAWAHLNDGTPIAIGKICETIFAPKRVFNF